MRFEVSHVLDAIERRLTTEPALARGVLDLAEIVRYVDLDGGRPATLLRLGMVVDALARHLAEEGIQVYCVVDKQLLSDLDQPSSERMVIRRWADDGHVEVVQGSVMRVRELNEVAGLPVISRNLPGLAALPGAGGAVIAVRGPVPTAPSDLGRRLMSRRWRCPDPECALFAGMRVAVGQPLPKLRGNPLCPRHDLPLSDTGPAPAQDVLAVRVNGVIKQRFLVTGAGPVTVGRAPEGNWDSDSRSIVLGPWLDEGAVKAVSRNHIVVAFDHSGLSVKDVSMNGAWIYPGGDKITPRQPRALGPAEYIELYPGVEIGRPGSLAGSNGAVGSVLVDAPTMSFRLPPS
ncbi:MAG: FHA domain-containing protein [Hamadaea sp.]|uniref:FHA domain-containing protein n=1 Tax=Hamadaea sp. TaxID=2024425 RepID=UPI0018150C25|nr:FHA domain-containing protein [Hamadaea sp.]NUR74288.1 FHA domain-containing protein [Hamadaea sp.]NUT24186.1 FHA domain-containing protein [Hamadaea sp.]